MDYYDVLNSSIHEFIKIYSDGTYHPVTEMDIQGYIFHLCLNRIKAYGLDEKIHINISSKLLGPKKKIDIVLNDEVALEVKFEADYPGVSKPVAFTEEIYKDLARLHELKTKGMKHCMFFLVDEDGVHYRKMLKEASIEKDKWIVVEIDGREHYIFLVEI